MEAEHCVASLCTRAVLHGACAERKVALLWNRNSHYSSMEDATMSRVKQASKTKRVTKAAMPALGAAGLTFALGGGASASAVPAADVPQTTNLAPTQALTLGEEEIADVSLATFYLFDKENTAQARGGVQLAWGCRCGGCRGCRCGAGCGSCGASWGVCRLC